MQWILNNSLGVMPQKNVSLHSNVYHFAFAIPDILNKKTAKSDEKRQKFL
jgi:hypothetical protein